MNDVKKFISDIISEAALDQRIPDGVVDLYNTDHVQVVAEKMYDAGADEFLIKEFIDKFVFEGKHPDRQAYNKDGWLVTFPSKEYRDAAIKRGTHSTSDPTHGKGGMNLYYKKRGKQKRQSQQTQTTAGEETPKEQPTIPDQKPKEPSQPPDQKPAAQEPQKKRPAPGRQVAPADDEGSFDYDMSKVQKTAEEPTEKPETSPEAEKQSDASKPSPSQAAADSQETSPQQPAAPQVSPYIELSKKFATSKGWTSTPYGEYRDLSGQTQAVVGLSGEVVPVKSVDRDEFKLFAEKTQK